MYQLIGLKQADKRQGQKVWGDFNLRTGSKAVSGITEGVLGAKDYDT
jgi:hypothetical protein